LAVGPRASTNGGPFRFVARNITVGQKAMGYAMLLPDPERWAGQELSEKPDGLSQGHWKNLVSQARAVRRETPEKMSRRQHLFVRCSIRRA
jgi:hypothetical protein